MVAAKKNDKLYNFVTIIVTNIISKNFFISLKEKE